MEESLEAQLVGDCGHDARALQVNGKVPRLQLCECNVRALHEHLLADPRDSPHLKAAFLGAV